MRVSPPISGHQAEQYHRVGFLRRKPVNNQPLCWERDGCRWPNQQSSRFIAAGGIRWHVQVMGQGPVVLLLHGTGASSHSWRELAPDLAHNYTVVVPDLPGHGFTEAPVATDMSLPGMANLLESLLLTLELRPELAVGHSAGAAIAAKMCLNDAMAPNWLVSINGALLPLSGIPGWVYSPIARMLASGGFWVKLLARSAADRSAVERLVQRTGSVIGPEGVDLYAKLLRTTSHTAAALCMMAHWDLRSLQRQLQDLKPNLLLLVGENDLMVPPEQANRLARLLPSTELRRMADCGHLLHEEKPQQTAALIRQYGQYHQGSAAAV
ncbi:MAG: alpha/beta fold hydrolase [Gammaproteobacteria bacterium]|nr:alpha/beta fold hydrolase [Gammaproteobacteria bacterium]